MSFNSSEGILRQLVLTPAVKGMNFFNRKVSGKGMNELSGKHCKPCEGGVCPLDGNQSIKHLADLPGWQLSGDGKGISRKFTFQNFEATMSFINAMADMAETEGHHPDFCAGYNYCNVSYTTHAIDGLSENDFICAVKLNALVDT